MNINKTTHKKNVESAYKGKGYGYTDGQKITGYFLTSDDFKGCLPWLIQGRPGGYKNDV